MAAAILDFVDRRVDAQAGRVAEGDRRGEVPVVDLSNCGAGAMPHLNLSASPLFCWLSSVATYQVPIGSIAACCLPNCAW